MWSSANLGPSNTWISADLARFNTKDSTNLMVCNFKISADLVEFNIKDSAEPVV